jgi:hypothetical protein
VEITLFALTARLACRMNQAHMMIFVVKVSACACPMVTSTRSIEGRRVWRDNALLDLFSNLNFS